MFKISSILQGSIFSTIEDEAGQTSIKVAEIFGDMKKTISLLREGVATTSVFSYDNSFSNSLSDDVIALDKYKTAVLSGVQAEEAFRLHLQGASTEAQEYANSVNVAAISTDDFEVKSKQNMISSLSQGKVWRDQKNLIDEFQTGLNNCKLTQEEYLSAIQKSNPQLAKYLSGLNGADASLKGYVGSLIKAKAATIGLQVASMALNTVISMGISFALSKIFEIVSNELIVTAEELRDKVTEVTTAFAEQKKELNNTKTRLDEITDRYDKLSKSVNAFGQNDGLSTEEFAEYNKLSNEIADMFPELIQGFTNERNAILTCKENVEALTEAYKENIIAANNAVISNGGNIFKDFKNAYQENKFGSFWSSSKSEMGKNVLQDALDGKDLDAWLARGDGSLDDAYKMLSDAGIESERWFTNSYTKADFIEEAVKTNKHIFKTIIDEFESGLEPTAESMKSLVEAYLGNKLFEDAYSDITPDMQSLINSIVSQLDYDFYSQYAQDGSPERLYSYVDNLLNSFSGLGDEYENAFSRIFNLKTQFEGNEIPFKVYSDAVEELIKKLNGIDNLSEDTKKILFAMFGIDSSDINKDGKVNASDARSQARIDAGIDAPNKSEYDAYVESVKKNLKDEFDDKAETLTLEDLKFAADLPDDTLYTWDELIEKIQEAKNALKDSQDEAATLGEQLSKIGGLSEGFDLLGKVYNDVKDGGSFDVGALFDTKFIETFSGLGDAYTNFMQVIGESPNNIAACQDAFNGLVAEFINNSNALDGLSEETRDVTIAYLEQMGVANAKEIVDHRLEVQAEKLKLTTGDLINTEYADIAAKYDLIKVENAEKQALAELALAKFDVNKEKIDASFDIDNLIAMANSANVTVASLENLAKAKQLILKAKEYEDDPFSAHIATYYYGEAQDLIASTPLEYNKLNPDSFKASSSKYTPTYKPTSSSGSNSSSSKEKEPETFDWIEIAIDRIKSAISKLDTKVKSSYNSWSTRNSALKSELLEIQKEITLQEKAYNRYMKQADSVGLAEKWAKKVREGSIDISSIKDENLSKQIDEYKKWYNAAIECSDAIDELKISLADLYSEKFSGITQDFENQLSLIEHDAKTYDNKISEYEARGYANTKGFYQSLMNLEKENSAKLKKEYESLTNAFNEAVNSGEIKEFSEEWYSMKNEINETNEAIQESTLSMIEFANAMQEIDWGIFEFMQDQISNINSEAEFLIDLMSNKDLFEDNGSITDEGLAKMGLHGISYNVYMRQADEYAKELLKIENELAYDPSNTTLIEKKQEYLELQRESILAAEDEKQAIIDMVKEGFDLELEYLDELINKYMDVLNAQKDLYDYQKKIEGITDEITSIEKQITAYSGDDSEEGRLKIQQLTKELKDSQSELEDTAYDQYIKDQETLLNELYSNYEEILNNRLNDIDTLLTNIFNSINTNAESIDGTISSIAGDVGIELSSIMNSLWKVNRSGDINGDGDITAKDALLIMKASAEAETLTEEQIKNADVNADAIVTASDARLAMRMAAGLDDLPTNRVISIYGDEVSTKLTTVNTILNDICEQVSYITNGIRADVNKDGKTDLDDVQMILNFSALEDGSYSLAYDFNNDGQVTASDTLPILDIIKGKISGFSSGGYIADLQRVAYNNGDDIVTVNTLKRGEAVLDPEQAAQFKSLVGNLTTLTGIVDISKRLNGIRDIGQVRNNASGEISNTFNIAIDHVEDYDDFVNQLKSDPKFEKMVQAMTVDRIVGKSSMAKNKYNW